MPPESIFSRMPSSLTATQRRIVDYLLANTTQAAFMTAMELARQVHTSDASIVRLAQALGFDGFHQLQRHLREQVKSRLDTASRLETSERKSNKPGEILARIIAADVENLRQTAEMVSTEAFDGAIRILRTAKGIGVLGLRSTHCLAQFFHSALRYQGRQARLITPGIAEMWVDLSLLGSEAVLVAFSFPRYARQTVEAVKAAKEFGMKVISVTDGPLSPLAGSSDFLLSAAYKSESFMQSFAAAFSLANALAEALAIQNGATTIDRLRKMEKLWHDKEVYFDPLPRRRRRKKQSRDD